MVVWPSRVRVGWADYTLRPYDRGEAQERATFGSHHTLTMEMRYDASLSPQRQAHTVLHELVHAIRESLWPAGFWGVGKAQEPDKAEETLASSMADGLSCVARDNPELWENISRYLREEAE